MNTNSRALVTTILVACVTPVIFAFGARIPDYGSALGGALGGAIGAGWVVPRTLVATGPEREPERGEAKEPGERADLGRATAQRPAAGFTRPPDVRYVPTPYKAVYKMLEMANIKPGDVLYDLGCGDGRIVITAARKYGIKAFGFDIDPARIKQSLANVRSAKVEHLVTIRQADIFTLDLSGANVVTLYLYPHLNVALMPQLRKLKPGSRIISYKFDMKGARPVRMVKNTFGTPHMRVVYKWVVPWKEY